MAQAKKKPAAGRGKKKKTRGWLLLVLGLGIGIASAYLIQMVLARNLHHVVAGWFHHERSAQHDTAAKKESDKPKAKFDFYTILPETETRLPDRGKQEPKRPKVDKDKPEEDVSYILQVGSFPSFDDADQLKAKLALQGLQAQIQRVAIEGKGEYHRVRLGPYDKLSDLDTADQQLSKMGIKTMRLKIKKGAG